MWLLIDDLRNANVDVIARTYDSAMAVLNTDIVWTGMVFDHDLGCEKNGYDILSWCIDNNKLPNDVQLITDNAAGLDKMGTALMLNGFEKIHSRKFKSKFDRSLDHVILSSDTHYKQWVFYTYEDDNVDIYVEFDCGFDDADSDDYPSMSLLDIKKNLSDEDRFKIDIKYK